MKISYNWIKTYLNTELNIQEISEILTDIGLEVENIEKEDILEINLTPNRSDAMSHYGVARDLYAALKIRGYNTDLIYPKINIQKENNQKFPFQIIINNPKKCLRYSALIFYQIQIGISPFWLQNRLKSIGVTPVNNVVDIINFIMHDIGQPLYAFDVDQIQGETIEIKTAVKNTSIKTLDNIYRTLNTEDLIIYDAIKPLCIAGILGGMDSSITLDTKNILLESAYFDPITIHKSVKRHSINTQTSFRFSRGIDPNQIIYALQKAKLLIKKNIGYQFTSNLIDIYPFPINYFKVNLNYKKMDLIIGEKISVRIIKKILFFLEIKIDCETKDSLTLLIPPYRIDVRRDIDVIEEILRIYSYNNIKIPKQINLYFNPKILYKQKIEENIAYQLVANGFYETIHVSLDKKNQYILNENTINILNPLSQDLALLRFNFLNNMLESIIYNINRKNTELKFFEWGKIYYKKDEKFLEENRLILIITSKKNNKENIQNSFFYLKGIIEQILQNARIKNFIEIPSHHIFLKESLIIQYQNQNLVELGEIKTEFTRKLNINQKIFFSEINWELFKKFYQRKKIQFKFLSQYPGSKRDLSLLIDKNILFNNIYQLIKSTEKKLIKNISLFDTYEGNRLPYGKKSYTLRVHLENENQTLTDEIINKTMKKIQKVLEKKIGAQIR